MNFFFKKTFAFDHCFWSMEESNNKYASKFMPTFNPLRPNIFMHILHTVLSTFRKVLTGRICVTIKTLSWWSFPIFSWPKCVILYCKEKIDATCKCSYSLGSKSQEINGFGIIYIIFHLFLLMNFSISFVSQSYKKLYQKGYCKLRDVISWFPLLIRTYYNNI